ncbi:MAG: aldo/keto reductase [Anaerolineae bacterium]
MKTYRLPNTDLDVSRIAHGCMTLGGLWNSPTYSAETHAQAVRVIGAALDHGINFFDHADIYGRGKSESVFGDVLADMPGVRQRIIIQTKCGIRFRGDPGPDDPGRYDFSYEYIVGSVEGSLRRLRTDVIDILLLHRPDALMEPAEVARAFAALHSSGKVRYFGVSNFNGAQIALLQKHLDRPLVANQLELNLLHNDLINDGVVVDVEGDSYSAVPGVLDYCRLHDILIQAWSPVARGHVIEAPEDADARVRASAGAVARLAEAKGVSREAIALAWLLRHPAGIQPVIGTTNVERIAASAQADDVELTRSEWYSLFTAGRGGPVP